MSTNAETSSRRPRWPNAAVWCVGVGLIANAAVMLWSKSAAGYPTDITFSQSARGQDVPATPADHMAGARGVYMMPAQLGPNTWGLYLLDLDAGNIVIYKALPDTNRFHLMAARNFRNDRFLEDLNNDSPTPKEIQKLIQQQRQRESLEGHGETPATTQP